MNPLPCFLTISGLLAFGVPSSLALAVPQNQESRTASERECEPVLKRRPPASESESTAGVSAQKAPDPICKTLRRNNFVTTENPVRIEFNGLHAFSETELLKTLREARIPVAGDRMPDSELLGRAVATLRDWYWSRGYMSVVVDVLGPAESKSVTFLINEGARFPIAAIRFEGTRVFSSQELAAKASEYLAGFEASRDGYDAAILDDSLRSVTNFVRSQGYLQAKLGPPKTELAGNGLVITVPFDEGPLYRLGEVNIEGSRYLSPRQIRELLRLQRGDAANGEAIGKWLFEDLKKAYGEAGYVEFTAEVDPEFKGALHSEKEGVVDLRVTIEEGKQFTLRSIRFLGADRLATDVQELLLIHEGDVYNQRLFERSIERLNKTGLFEEIDKDGDTNFTTNDEGLVDIVIKVRKAAP